MINASCAERGDFQRRKAAPESPRTPRAAPLSVRTLEQVGPGLCESGQPG